MEKIINFFKEEKFLIISITSYILSSLIFPTVGKYVLIRLLLIMIFLTSSILLFLKTIIRKYKKEHPDIILTTITLCIVFYCIFAIPIYSQIFKDAKEGIYQVELIESKASFYYTRGATYYFLNGKDINNNSYSFEIEYKDYINLKNKEKIYIRFFKNTKQLVYYEPKIN